MMIPIPGVLTPSELAQIRQGLERAEWIDGRGSVGSQGAHVKHNRQLPENSPQALELGALVSRALMASPLFFSAALPLRILPPYFNSYAGGEHYGLHVDGAIRHPAHAPGRAAPAPIRTDVSVTVFLNQPEDYQGGELVVVDTYGTHEVKLAAGDAIVYPSSSLHRVAPVTSGQRLASFLWLQSMLRDDQQRRMLFELDQNIQRLRAAHGEDEVSVGLTGHYHNLLRMWAEM